MKAIEFDLDMNNNSSSKRKNAKKGKKNKKKNFSAEKIISSMVKDGQLLFMVKWHNKPELTFVPVDQVKQKFPHLMMEYFERRLRWHPIPE